MKKVIFLLISIIYSLSSVAQQTSLNEMVSIQLPVGAKKLNNEQAMAFINNKFGSDVAASNILKTNPEHVYLINDILVSFIPGTAGGPFGGDYLLNEKKGLDGLFKKTAGYTSQIKTVNNNQILVCHYMTKSFGIYRFLSINSTGTRSLNCRLQFDKADIDKGALLSDNLLQNIMFTK
ncbi:hypothetical protein SAMN05428975_5404 [Mucilaginibacter sp. OK268]|uniref:hypothetical protein n=1 Tax=Mucilaginibacter sp. OK268 TaxID=1881048 RepID=UPI00087FF0E1|nr:hypothetical protein [Mucilaginibacter sp. OK268]SDQ00462.1 hypothetical protein SAMN05428975_5404 [Mucilaginibacter sp. OK268]